MLEDGTKKSGRGKRTKREPQTRPLIVSAARSRVVEKLVISAPTCKELRAYVRWAANLARIAEDEAMVLTLDRAIGDLLRKDELWQSARDNEHPGAPSSLPPRPANPIPPPASGGSASNLGRAG